jgi:hypothetical protein
MTRNGQWELRTEITHRPCQFSQVELKRFTLHRSRPMIHIRSVWRLQDKKDWNIYGVFAPLLVPLVPHLNIDPVTFGVVVVTNLAIGMLTPPMGICLFVSCSIAGISLERISRAVAPFLLVMIADLLIVTFVPFFTTFIPKMFLG